MRLFTNDKTIVFKDVPGINRAKLNVETAKPDRKGWHRVFTDSKPLHLDSDLGMVDIAFAIQQDESEKVPCWMEQIQLLSVSDLQARGWLVNRPQPDKRNPDTGAPLVTDNSC